MTISADVHILTTAELERVKDLAFQNGASKARRQLDNESRVFGTAQKALKDDGLFQEIKASNRFLAEWIVWMVRYVPHSAYQLRREGVSDFSAEELQLLK